VGPPRTFVIDRAGADDVLQLAVDRGRVPMAIGALLVFDPGSRPSADAVRSTLLERAAAVPRLGQRLVRTPPGAGRPIWVAAGATALAGLVDEVTVDADAGPEPLLAATATLVTTRLGLERPLWRARLLLDAHGHVAGIALVAHHVLADGMGGLAVLGALADHDGGRPRSQSSAATAVAEQQPAWGELARDAWGSRLRGLRGIATRRRADGSVRRLGGGVRELGLQRPRLADRCSLLGRTGAHRRLAVATADLAVVRDAARAHGASVNDVVVTAVTGALVELLARRGESVAELVVSVPVSRRAQGEAGSLGNSTGVVPVRVPAVPDAATRLAALVAERDRVRGSARGGSAAVLTPAFRGLAAVGAFQAFVDHQRLVHTFVTNVRGPAHRMSVAGAEVVAVLPVAVNPGNVAVSFDVLSYAGTLAVTLVCDPGLVPEAAWLAQRVTAGLTASG
jgi:diacylglycerol O-acyltransferase / wax synthase